MTELPAALLPPASAPTRRTAARVLPAAQFERRGAPQPDANVFQDALALIMGIGLDTASGVVPGVAATTLKAGNSGQAEEDTAADLESTLAAAGLALPAVPALPPTLTPIVGDVPATVLVASKEFVSARLGAPSTELKTSAEPAAADLVGAGRLAPPTSIGLHNEATFSSTLLNHIKPESEPATALLVAAQAIEPGASAAAQSAQAQPGVVEVRVGERGWDQALGEKLVWMTSQKKQVAELHLNPPDLGPLKITITLDQNQASAQFVSAHASVREAIESALPRLREMLADGGITLGNASVGSDAFREPAQPQPRANATQPVATSLDPGTTVSGTRLLRHWHGLVDTFA